MKRLLVASVAATILPFAPVARAAPSPFGFTCGFGSVLTVESSQTSAITGGPLALTDDTDPAVTYPGTLTCTIQTGANGTHGTTANDAASITSNSGRVVTTAGTVTYEVGPDDPVYICTEVDTDGGTVYWDAETGDWSDDPTALCELAVHRDSGLGIPIDPYVCPFLALLLPPEGDIVLPDPVGKVWDCPPYDW